MIKHFPFVADWPNGLHGFHPKKQFFVYVDPHESAGYWHVTRLSLSDNIAEGTTRGVVSTFLPQAIELISGSTIAEIEWSNGNRNPDRVNRNIAMPEPRDQTPHAFDVYFIQAACGGPIKIGASLSVKERVAHFQVGCPFDLLILGTIPGIGIAGKRKIHKKFSWSRLHGEWFQDTKGLLDYIKTHCKERI